MLWNFLKKVVVAASMFANNAKVRICKNCSRIFRWGGAVILIHWVVILVQPDYTLLPVRVLTAPAPCLEMGVVAIQFKYLQVLWPVSGQAGQVCSVYLPRLFGIFLLSAPVVPQVQVVLLLTADYR
jgi:hypothetical protein